MTTFASAVQNQTTRTTNGMVARKSTANACVDLFYKIGASRGKDIIPDFTAAYVEDRETALRIALWARDARGGAGERKIFRDILQYLEKVGDEDAVVRLMYKTPEVGRWDDLLIFQTEAMKHEAYNLVGIAIAKANGLCAKWMPRKGETALELRAYLGLSPKEYRKTLVGLTQVVEQQMCAKNWDSIDFSHVPSLAAARYRSAFYRNTPKYKEYVDALVKGDNPKVKVNAGAVYPYDVLKSVLQATKMYGGVRAITSTELDFITKQWEALENFVGDNNILPMIDVSGSMECPAGGNSSLTCMDVAVSLGMYCSDKNTGKFKDMFLTFSGEPELQVLRGNIVQKLEQVKRADWGMNTNIVAAMDKILKVAVDANLPQSEMPKMLVIFSDMQFDRCANFDDSAMQGFRRKFERSGYELPQIVFWNLNAHDNVPVSSTESGVALVSGFSPAIMKALLSGNMEEFTPEAIMRKTIGVDRYNF